MSVQTRVFSDYKSLLELDNSVYPANDPVTVSQCKQWYIYNPELCFALTQGGKDIGICVWIPLNKSGWQQMVEGKIQEHSIKPEHIFTYIEKVNNSSISIWQEALVQTNNIVKAISKSIEVYGMSAYCTTPMGVSLITKKWEFQETGYISDEYIVTSPSNTVTVKIYLSQKEAEEYRKQKYTLQRCVFVGTTKNVPSIVWQYIQNPKL